MRTEPAGGPGKRSRPSYSAMITLHDAIEHDDWQAVRAYIGTITLTAGVREA